MGHGSCFDLHHSPTSTGLGTGCVCTHACVYKRRGVAEMLIISWMASLAIFPCPSHPVTSFCSQDPRDAPPPTRAETREERMERKVCHVCLMAPYLPFASSLFPDIRARLCVFSGLPFFSQRREKIERRQQEVETELKMCKSLSPPFMCPSRARLCFSPPGPPQDSNLGK